MCASGIAAPQRMAGGLTMRPPPELPVVDPESEVLLACMYGVCLHACKPACALALHMYSRRWGDAGWGPYYMGGDLYIYMPIYIHTLNGQ